ncbi:MAG: ATP-dependent endonuclease [Bdellovibrionales bacterium]
MRINDRESQFEGGDIEIPDDKNMFVFVGSNNSGKSTFLRSIGKTFGPTCYIVNVNRTILAGEGAQDRGYLKSYNNYVNQALGAQDDNMQRPMQALQDLFNLKDAQRMPIIEWYNKHFPTKVYEEKEDPENSASPSLLKINGHSITKQGSGMRATLEIFIKLFDPNIKMLCIDEPELGLEPTLQKYLFQAIKSKASAEKRIFLATHSHHFLDYETPQNNYVCSRSAAGKISVEPVSDLKPVIFRLLGNTLSSLLLPENVLILEGVSDNTLLNKCLILLGKKHYSVHSADADGNIKYALNAITQFLRFNSQTNSVYAQKVYVIADHAKDILVREWRTLLPEPSRQLKVLNKNGIEYFYPERILRAIFSTTESKDVIISTYLSANPYEYNGIRLTKVELANKVAEQLELSDLDDPANDLFTFLKGLS